MTFLKTILLGIPLTALLFTSFTSVQVATQAPKEEMRAAWISTVSNIDMRPGMTEKEYTAWAESTIQVLERKNFNTVILQVKPNSDALYSSKLAPWSSYITGQRQGTDPGYDPLKIMLEIAHEHGLELHAWINPYRVTTVNQSLSDLANNHIAVQNPEWVVKHDQQYYLDPGIPGVQAYLVDVVNELVANYKIDAVHMDDYFYPGPDFADQETFDEYGSDFAHIGDWRRHNVNQLVENINQIIKAIKPWVQFGISPSGIWRNQAIDPTGSATNGNAHYDQLFADSRHWIQSGSIDYITPQIYWSRQLSAANYSVLLEWWSKQVETRASVHPVHLYMGMADYKVNNNFDTAWQQPRELPEQILDNRRNGIVKGQMHFTLRDIVKNSLDYGDIVKKEIYTAKALTPSTPWNGSKKPRKPASITVDKQGKSLEISIHNSKQTDAKKYVVYRFENDEAADYQNPQNIAGIVYDHDGMATFIDHKIDLDSKYTYGVTAVSPTGIESKDARVKKWVK